ncbi:MAG TPA: NAD(P)/FAD-dependent oxidoreductase [Bacteroidales bacterium]|nr:NAD(P)/FAD-dependent oxidoreductase [Bacteroidales bacterium]
MNKKYDSIVVGSGPNGLAAAITLQQAGLSVLLVEGKETVGGGMRSAPLTLPGFVHDVCSAIHPLGAGSPFFNTLPLEKFGLTFIRPDIAAAHPFDNGEASVLYRSVEDTARSLGMDEQAYKKFMTPLVNDWPRLAAEVLAPLHFPGHPLRMARFGLKALSSAVGTARRFRSDKARGLWAGIAAHSVQPLTSMASSAAGLALMIAGHTTGWPLPKGGANAIANALADYFVSLGGSIQTGFYVESLNQLPEARAVLFDVTPKQLLEIAGERFTTRYTKQLQQYRYGPGVFKIDWALDGPVPFTAPECRKAGTVHLGNSLEEITSAEQQVADGLHPEKPFVLLTQQSLFDPSRAPVGKHTAWAYCHVPNGSQQDMTAAIEQQVERFAPGFRKLIMAKHTMNTTRMEAYNPNYIGGDIGGGNMDIGQLFTRPALRLSPYTTPAKGLYICSSSTPPGGGVHGMCGYHAAKKALKEMFGQQAVPLTMPVNSDSK